jgi:ferredoxin--NADP+ reductase
VSAGYYQLSVHALEFLGANTWVLRTDGIGPFQAGQCIALSTDPARIEPRVYSIASGEAEHHVDILFNVVEEGVLTPELVELRPGDLVYASAASGSFVDEPERKSWWICAGTGLAPFLSMVRSGQTGGKILVHGSRYLAGFYYAEELAASLGDRYIRCCSAERGSGVYGGRLTNYLRGLGALPTDARYMLCGSTGMIVEVREILLAAGVPFSQILSEIYF